MTVRGRSLLVAALAALCALAWLGAPRLMRRMTFFRVRQVEVVGLRYLDERDVVRRLGLPADASIVDALDGARAAAAAIPGVVAASVERRLPGTLRVTVLEEMPVALTPQEGRLVLIDRRGRVLPFDPTRAPASLPVAERHAGAAALLARLMVTDPLLFGAIDGARMEEREVVLELGRRQVRLRTDASPRTLRSAAAVWTMLEDQGRAWREIDARFVDRVFVKKGTT